MRHHNELKYRTLNMFSPHMYMSQIIYWYLFHQSNFYVGLFIFSVDSGNTPTHKGPNEDIDYQDDFESSDSEHEEGWLVCNLFATNKQSFWKTNFLGDIFSLEKKDMIMKFCEWDICTLAMRNTRTHYGIRESHL